MSEQLIHPYCDLFPDLPEAELNALADDIREHGQHQPIYRWNKQIIDGKNRFKACQLAGVPPNFEAWVPTKPHDAEATDAEIWAFARSQNLHRRQLTQSQYAVIAAFKANMKAGENQHSKEVAHSCATSQTDAAAELGVSRRAVQQAAAVIEHGSKPLVDAVRNGSVTVADASHVVDLPKAEQTAAVAKVKAKKAKTVTAAAKPPKPSATIDPEAAREANILGKQSPPSREPGDESESDPQAFKIQKSKAVKTVEALMRAFDDLNGLHPHRGHAAAIDSCKVLLRTAKEWPL